MKVLNEILEKSKFNDKEYKTIIFEIESFLLRLNLALKQNGINAKPILGGSSAKGTIVKGDFDCDIFVRFDYTFKDKNISDILEKVLQSFNNLERMHGSRDYFQIIDNDIKFEVVPVLKIDNPEKAENVTDMSPLHVAWIKTKLEKNPKLIDEIILAKIFCKAQGIYGAESYISGFSGHVLDILVAYYGSFIKLLENAKNWQKYKVIDIEGFNTRDGLNKSKISPLIVIDPVDKHRNAAAALSIDKFKVFKKYAGEFVRSPSKEFFIKKKVTIESLKIEAGKNKLFTLSARPKEGKIDVTGGKLLKVYNYITNQLSMNDFMVIDSGWEWDKKKDALLWYIVDPQELTEEKLHIGPPLIEKEDAKAFKEKHKESYIKNKRLQVMQKREYRKPEELFKDLKNSEYIKQRTTQTKIHIKAA